MTDCRLTYHTIHPWHTENGISVKGAAFLNHLLLNSSELIGYFQKVCDANSFQEHLQRLSGHFSVVIENDDSFFIAVDTIRTFPLFIQKNKTGILLSDAIDTASGQWDETETEYFKKVFCTLENNTLLQDWKQLQAGEYGIIPKSSSEFQIQTYYHHAHAASGESERDLKSKLSTAEQNIIDKAITYAANRTILIPLSGGYDSRYLLALLKQKKYAKIECFTYGKKDSYEVRTAKKVCEKLQIKWHYIEYADELLQSFFSEKWQQYSEGNHNYSSLPHEQDFFALYYLHCNDLLPDNAVVMNGFCQDIMAGSFLEPLHSFNLTKFIGEKYDIQPKLSCYENSWNAYQEWLVKNRLSKFIVNSVRIYETFGLDFYLPFWDTNWIHFWYSLPITLRMHQRFYHNHLFDGIFRKYDIRFKKPTYDDTDTFYNIKRLIKAILPLSITKYIKRKNSQDASRDVNNTLFLYEELYKQLKTQVPQKDFRINNIHALYLLQNLKEKHQL